MNIQSVQPKKKGKRAQKVDSAVVANQVLLDKGGFYLFGGLDS